MGACTTREPSSRRTSQSEIPVSVQDIHLQSVVFTQHGLCSNVIREFGGDSTVLASSSGSVID